MDHACNHDCNHDCDRTNRGGPFVVALVVAFVVKLTKSNLQEKQLLVGCGPTRWRAHRDRAVAPGSPQSAGCQVFAPRCLAKTMLFRAPTVWWRVTVTVAPSPSHRRTVTVTVAGRLLRRAIMFTHRATVW